MRLNNFLRGLTRSDASQPKIEVIEDPRGGGARIEAATQPQASPSRESNRTATIKLVSPSPPQSSGASTVVERNTSLNDLSVQPSSISTSTEIESNESQLLQQHLRATPIYDMMTSTTPSRGLHQGSSIVRLSSPQLGSSGTFSRSMSPSTSEEGQTPQKRNVSGLGNTSSKMIQQLMDDNQKLQRDLDHQKLLLAEAKQTHEIDIFLTQQATEAAASARALFDSNNNILKRQDKKIEKVTQELAEEKSKRKAAEEKAVQIVLETRSKVAEADRMVAEQRELATHYQQQHDIIQSAYLKNRQPVQPELDKLHKMMTDISFKIHEMALNQEENEAVRAKDDARHASFLALGEKFNDEKDHVFGDALNRIKEKEAKAESVMQEAIELRDKLRWVMAVKKNVKDAE